MPVTSIAAIMGEAGKRLLNKVIERAGAADAATADPIYTFVELLAREVLDTVDLKAVFQAAQDEFNHYLDQRDRWLETFGLLLQHGGAEVAPFTENLWITYVFQMNNDPDGLWKQYPRLLREASLQTDLPLPRRWGDWVLPIQTFMDIAEGMLFDQSEAFRKLVVTADLAPLFDAVLDADAIIPPLQGHVALDVSNPRLRKLAILETYLEQCWKKIGHINARGYLRSAFVEIPTSEVFTSRRLLPLADWIRPADYMRYRIATYSGPPYDLERAPLVEPEDGSDQAITIHQAVSRHAATLVLAESGGGKTLLLRHLAMEYTRNLRDRQLHTLDYKPELDGEVTVQLAHPLPVYVDLAGFMDNRLPNETLVDYAARAVADLSGDEHMAGLLDEIAAAGNCLFLLDGLDQAATDEQRRMLAFAVSEAADGWIARGNRVVVTSHLSGYDAATLSSIFAPYVLLGLDRTQAATFTYHWVRKLARERNRYLTEAEEIREAEAMMIALRQELYRNEPLFRLVRSPLLLRLLISVYRPNQALPAHRVGIYQIVADALVRAWASSSDPAHAPPIPESEATAALSHLAFWLHRSRPGGQIDRHNLLAILSHIQHQLHPDITPEHVRAFNQSFLEWAGRGDGVFVELTPGQYGFIFQAMQEYFAARYLVSSYRLADQRIRANLHDPRWDSVIRLAVGFTALWSQEDPSDLIETAILARGQRALDNFHKPGPFEDLLVRDLFFAIDLLGSGVEMRSDVARRIVGEVMELWLRGDRSSPGRMRYIYDTARRYLINLDGSTASHYAFDAARERLKASGEEERAFAVDALTFWPDLREEAVGLIIGLGREQPPLVQRAMACALGRLDVIPIEAYMLLLHFVADADESVSAAGREALAKLPPVPLEALSLWLNYLRKDDIRQQRIALRVFRDIATLPAQVIDELLHLLNAPDPDLRRAVFDALEGVANLPDHALIAICRAARTTDAPIRLAAIEVLSRPALLPAEVVEYLIDWTYDPDVNVRRAAARALGACSNADPRILDALIERLNDGTDSVRAEAVKLLACKGHADSRVVHQLTHIMRDTHHLVRCAVAESLKCFDRADDTLRSVLDTLLRDGERIVRETALKAAASFPDPGAEIINVQLVGLAVGSDQELGALAIGALAAQRHLSDNVLRRLVDALPLYWRERGSAIVECLKAHRPLSMDVINEVMDLAVSQRMGHSGSIGVPVEVQAMALEVLGGTLDDAPDVTRILLNAANNSRDPHAQIAALRGLAATRTVWRDVRTILMHLLRSGTLDVRCAAAITLGTLVRNVPDPPFSGDDLLEIAARISDLLGQIVPRAAWDPDTRLQNELLHALNWIVARARPGLPRLPAYSEDSARQLDQ